MKNLAIQNFSVFCKILSFLLEILAETVKIVCKNVKILGFVMKMYNSLKNLQISPV